MKVYELEEILKKLPKDFDIEISTSKRIPEDILKTMSYPYPLEYSKYNLELGDICWSSKIISLHVNLDKPLD